jgi:uncharacterized protein
MNNDGYSPSLPLTTIKTHYDMIFDIESNIKQNFKNLLLTNPGERMMIPDFGCGVRRYLFEYDINASFDDLTTIIQDQIDTYMPFIEIEDISLDTVVLGGTSKEHTLAFTISYTVSSLDIQDSLLITT